VKQTESILKCNGIQEQNYLWFSAAAHNQTIVMNLNFTHLEGVTVIHVKSVLNLQKQWLLLFICLGLREKFPHKHNNIIDTQMNTTQGNYYIYEYKQPKVL
jgi:hypothetical protein